MERYEVIVGGAGFAGTAAAIAAAREGAKVLLIGNGNCLGGAACESLVNPFMVFWTCDENKRKVYLSNGIFLEILDELNKLDADLNGTEYTPKEPCDMRCFNEEHLKIVLQRMALDAGVEMLFHTSVTGVKKTGQQITAVTVFNKTGTYDIGADCVIDTTGDADIAAFADCPIQLGRASDGLCQPMTLCFRVSDIDKNKFSAAREGMQALYKKMQADGQIKNPREDILLFSTAGFDIDTRSDNMLHFNSTRVIKRDPTDAKEITKAEMEAREQVFELFKFLKRNVEGCERATLRMTGVRTGVRESRKIVGEYVLTQDDLIACTKFEDSISAGNYDIDIHNPAGGGTSHYYFKDGTYYTIPYRSLIAKNNDNLLVAGRCISSTHEAQASVRIMPICCTMGQAAGTAAGMAARARCGVRDIDVKQLQKRLQEKGMFI